MRYLISTVLSTLIAGQVFAGDTAFLVANEDYRNGRDIAAAGELLDATIGLEKAGFAVTAIDDAELAELRSAFVSFERSADGTGRIVIAASGHFVQSKSGAWLLGVDADAPSLGDIDGVSVDALIEVAARAPGKAVVLLGTEDRRFDLGSGLEAGVRLANIPQGVTVIVGPASDVAEFAKDVLPVAGQSLATALRDWPSLTGSGFLAPLVPFVTDEESPAPSAVDTNSAERAFWAATQNIGTVEAYRAYLSRYERGLFAEEANAEIARIEAEPALRAEAEEAALKLSRDDRREVQRSLSLIGFDPRGIDGIFGRGSRAAISAFQTSIGEDPTGYLTRSQVEKLAIEAEIKGLELEREAQLRKAELERKDRAYWEATGALGDEAGLRAYLARYPDGVFAEIATVRLEPFEAQRRAQAQAQDRAAWDVAVSLDTVQGYQDYVQEYPTGAFVDQARERMTALQQADQDSDVLAEARRTEERLGLNKTTRLLIEDNLAKAGLRPGAVDGEFDEDTRRAIRRFQEERNLPKTGYLNQETVVRLLAGALFRLP